MIEAHDVDWYVDPPDTRSRRFRGIDRLLMRQIGPGYGRARYTHLRGGNSRRLIQSLTSERIELLTQEDRDYLGIRGVDIKRGRIGYVGKMQQILRNTTMVRRWWDVC